MGKDERRAKIVQLEKTLGTKLICFLTSDRTGLEPPANFITRDCVKIIEQHLDAGQCYDVLSLYLVSHGGDLDVPWGLVNLLRSHCKKLQLIMPYICHSAATMIALGCDQLIAGPRAQLSPTDPTLQLKMGMDENAPVMQFGVEDVNAFVDFVRSTLGSQFSRYGHEALSKLIDRVPAEALGSIKRTYFRTRLIIEKMLRLTSKKYTKKEVQRLVSLLTVAYFSHSHFISRQEMTSDLKLPVVHAEKLKVDGLIWELYEEYAAEFESRRTFDMQSELHRSTANPVTIQIKAKFVETAKRTDTYVQTVILQGTGVPNFNFTVPQNISGLPDQAVLGQIVQHFLNELNSQLRPFLVAKKLASFGEWKSE